MKVFAEVAPEVPTAVRSGTVELIENLIASNASWVAVDTNGVVVAYALANTAGNELSLWYVGVTEAARNHGVFSSLISKLKEYGRPITADVHQNNKSSMIARFKHFGFVRQRDGIIAEQTKWRWEPD